METVNPPPEGDHNGSTDSVVHLPEKDGLGRLLPWIWLPIPILLAAVVSLRIIGEGTVWEPPYLLGILNFIFQTAVMLFIAFFAGRSYVLAPYLSVLFLGSGCLCFGVVSFIGAVMIHLDQVNLALTIYNSGVLITGMAMLLSALAIRFPGTSGTRLSGLVVSFCYAFLLTCIALLTLAAWAGLTPPFFIQGQGGTPLRQTILGTAVGAFVLSAVITGFRGPRRLKIFSVWFAGGLGLIACGLVGVLISQYVGSVLGWTGRFSQYLGGLYILAAIYHVSGENRRWELSLKDALLESEERFRLAASSANLGAYNRDFRTGQDYYSPEFLAIYGIEEGEAMPLENGLPAGTHPADRQRIIDQVRERRSRKLPSEFSAEHRIVRPDGEVRWVQTTGRMRFSPRNVPLGETGIIQDITERKLSEQKLRRNEKMLRDVLDNLAALVGVMTPDGRLIEANRTALALGGISREEAVGLPFEMTYWWSWSPETQKRLRLAIAKAAAGESCRYDAVVRMAEGKMRTIDFMLAPLFDERGKVKYLIPSAIDITERMRTEEERKDLIADLEAANRELQGFTYSVSHDLRAPLRHMHSFTQLLKEKIWTDIDEEGRLYLEKVLKSSRRMATLVDELLEFSRMRRIELQENPVDLNSVIAETRRSLLVDSDDGEILWKISELPIIRGDEEMLQLVFSNLVGNAVKFSAGRAPAVIEIGYRQTLQECVLFVRDNGIGFDMQYYDKLFGIFQRLHTHEEIEGTGIGLANVARIVERHGGRVWAEGKVEEGAVFFVALPWESRKNGGKSEENSDSRG